MQLQAKNNHELIAILKPFLKEALEYTVEKIWNDNHELIRQIVYDVYSPTWYDRTDTFKKSWKTEVFQKGYTVLEGKFEYIPSEIQTTSEDYIRPYLAEIIYQGLSGDFTGEYKYAHQNPRFKNEPWANKRDVWKVLKKRLGKQKIKQYFTEGLKNSGLNIRVHKGFFDVKEENDE